jgi:hypothetical protein
MNFEEYKKHRQRMKDDPDYLNKIKKEEEEKEQKWWMNLKPFVTERDVPQLPNPLTDFYVKRLIQLGATPIDKLEVGEWYYGNYRNAKLGKWNGKTFDHIRWSHGYYWDECNHFQDDDRYALFVPLRKATKEEIDEELKKNVK